VQAGASIETVSLLLRLAGTLLVVGVIVFAFLGLMSAATGTLGWLANLFRSEESKRASDIRRQLRRRQ
jgi:Na+-transporting methylmalonyl-CoA/oxaloacetate decarboxylase gamma subunit